MEISSEHLLGILTPKGIFFQVRPQNYSIPFSLKYWVTLQKEKSSETGFINFLKIEFEEVTPRLVGRQQK